MNQLGNRIQKARKNMNLTQAQLGEKSGVTASCVGKIESGDRTPRPLTLYYICRALGITMKDALVGE